MKKNKYHIPETMVHITVEVNSLLQVNIQYELWKRNLAGKKVVLIERMTE
jgi:hypothetical protein